MKTLRTRALRLRTLALTLAVTLGLAASTQAVVVPGGEILTQTWDNTSEPYVVTGTITVTGDQSLTIGPGVSIEVANGAQIVVQGSLTINGADSAPVWIGAQFGQTWGGVRFMNATGPNFMSYTYILGATAAGVAPPDWNGGGVYIQESDVSFSHVEIDGGNANYRGGGVYITGSTSDVTFTDSQVSNNTSGDNGGGIYVSTARVTFTRCKLVNDRSTGGYGGALHATSGAIVNLTNCTVTKNTGAYASGAIYAQDNAAVTLLNSIVWGNLSGGLASTNSTVTVNYSDVQGGVWPDGTGNISEDPLFESPEDNMFNLTLGSPAIDAGDPAVAYNDPDGTRNDMGAIYFPQQQQVQEFLQLPTATVPAGTSGDFAITGTVVGNETGTGVKITFTIDPGAVQSVTLVSTPFPSSELNRDGNTVHLSLASEENVTIANGTLATLSFTAPANAVRSTTPLTWVTLTEDPEFGTSINEQPVAVLIPGTVSIPDNPPVWTQEPRSFPQEGDDPIFEN
ncbi:MAG TPA: right-handed parallel beta-helix repeat-containing protein, partial [Candidatus Latescibacteria bacterium]|nr:right-handed parallel beta-helix repeat-containing protein [Candidatus Latescibacterota bacterium]